MTTAPLNLVAGSIGVAALDDTGFSVRRLIAALDRLLDAYGEDRGVTGEVARRAATLAQWTRSQEGNLVCTYLLDGEGMFRLAVPQRLFVRLFERFYGGIPSADAALRLPPSKTQTCFAQRLAGELAPIVTAAWARLADARPQLTECDFEAGDTMPADEGLIVIDLPLPGNHADEAISIAFATAMVAAMRGRLPAPRDHLAATMRQGKDALLTRFRHVRLPVRSVLARPELPASRLLTLKVGDFLPISFPASVPLLIDTHLLAHGRLGESDGRAAVRIDTLTEGSGYE